MPGSAAKVVITERQQAVLRKMSTGEIGGRPRQIIVTTHSPTLLNFADPKEVRIFSRTEDGGAQVTPMEKVSNLKSLLHEFAPGELWYLLGEDRLVEEATA